MRINNNPRTSVFFVLFLNLTINCIGQDVHIVKRDGSRITTRISATSDQAIFTNSGSIKYTDIDSAYFNIIREEDAKLISNLKTAGVNYSVQSFTDAAKRELMTENSLKNKIINTPDNIQYRLDKFRVQSATGYGVQILGAMVIAGAIALQSSYNKKYDDDYTTWLKKPTGNPPTSKTVSPAIPAAGGALMVIGFGINVDALKHLKSRP